MFWADWGHQGSHRSKIEDTEKSLLNCFRKWLERWDDCLSKSKWVCILRRINNSMSFTVIFCNSDFSHIFYYTSFFFHSCQWTSFKFNFGDIVVHIYLLLFILSRTKYAFYTWHPNSEGNSTKFGRASFLTTRKKKGVCKYEMRNSKKWLWRPALECTGSL